MGRVIESERDSTHLYRHHRSDADLFDRVKNAMSRADKAVKDKREEYNQTAPFRVTISPNTEKNDLKYFFHDAKNAIQIVCIALPECLEGDVDIYVQTRIGTRKEFHSGFDKPHLAVKLDEEWSSDQKWFGLYDFCKNFNVSVGKTRLPDFCKVAGVWE